MTDIEQLINDIKTNPDRKYLDNISEEDLIKISKRLNPYAPYRPDHDEDVEKIEKEKFMIVGRNERESRRVNKRDDIRKIDVKEKEIRVGEVRGKVINILGCIRLV